MMLHLHMGGYKNKEEGMLVTQSDWSSNRVKINISNHISQNFNIVKGLGEYMRIFMSIPIKQNRGRDYLKN